MRILSGIQSSGETGCHLGNYFGAIRQHVAHQSEHEGIFFIADYHSMTTVRDAALRRRMVLDVALDYLACGLDPAQAILYRQSDLAETCELAWMLSTVTPMGLLQRAHSYKDKVAQGVQADHGLFAYPVLMAADILQFNPDLVPVGQDQKQHLEMARDMAQRFNHVYEREVFALPEPLIPKDVAVVPGLDGRKMSKTYENTIGMFWPAKRVKKAVMAVVTDSTPVEDPKDTDATVFQLWSLFASPAERESYFAEARKGGLGYGHVKQDLLARLMDYFGPMRERREELAKRPDDVEDVLSQGVARARELMRPILSAARDASGLGRPA